MKFSKKTAHRLIIALSMFAPVIYLFGAMFFGLAGAHGEKIYEDEIVIDQTPTYEELMTPENFRYDAFDWDNGHGTRVGFSLGYYFIAEDSAMEDFQFDLYFSPTGVWLQLYQYYSLNDFQNHGLGFYGFGENNDWGYIEFYQQLSEMNYEYYEPYYACFYIVSDAQDRAVAYVLNGGIECYVSVSNGWTIPQDSEGLGDFLVSGNYLIYFDDGGHLPSGVSWSDELASYFVPSVKPVEVSSSTYTASIFGQFFPHDNFLERVGVNALSANPIGFAPFGTFLSYLDQNMLHGSQSQMALMIYGEVYWALHIVLADLVYHVAVFFPNLIERVFDWFGQKGLNDD